jgi:hypothetical protein
MFEYIPNNYLNINRTLFQAYTNSRFNNERNLYIVAIVSIGKPLTVYVNGTKYQSSSSLSSDIVNTLPHNFNYLSHSLNSAQTGFLGYIEELRIWSGELSSKYVQHMAKYGLHDTSTHIPTILPNMSPTISPPVFELTLEPYSLHSKKPTSYNHSLRPSLRPTFTHSTNPTFILSSNIPSSTSKIPSSSPLKVPVLVSSFVPTISSSSPSFLPSIPPTTSPSFLPSIPPTTSPSFLPSIPPTTSPISVLQSTIAPSLPPTKFNSIQPFQIISTSHNPIIQNKTSNHTNAEVPNDATKNDFKIYVGITVSIACIIILLIVYFIVKLRNVLKRKQLKQKQTAEWLSHEEASLLI